MNAEYIDRGDGRGWIASGKVVGVATVLILVSLAGFALIAVFKGGSLHAHPPTPVGQNQIVRGYIAVTVGQSPLAERSGLYSRLIPPKDIYLPGVETFLEAPPTAVVGKPAITDLSGRFTLYAPETGRYHVCWKSRVYGAGCTAEFISAGTEAQFISTVRISVPREPGYTAIVGHVTNADGALTRTFDPLLNINAFAKVELEDEKGNGLASVYVNNFGDYLLPRVPAREKVKLIASIESAKFTQEVWPEARIETAPVNQVNLKFENHRPHLHPLVAFDAVSNRRIQNAAPGAQVSLEAEAHDIDRNPVEFAWFVDPSEGQLSQKTGSKVQWKLPSTPGRYTVTVVAYDNKGGYDKATLSVLADGQGVPFSGIVVEPSGRPVNAAEVEINGSPAMKTGGDGRFSVRVHEADRYVVNVRREGYALNSQVFDGGVTGGRWILRPAQVVTIDPRRNVTIVHRRTERDCPGPDSLHAGLGAAGASLNIPQWQDGSGNAVDPPAWWTGPRKVQGPETETVALPRPAPGKGEGKRQPVILPRQLKLPPCAGGVSVQIPANSIEDASGRLASSPFKATISTVDLLSPQQMPGDDSVVPTAGGGAFLQGFGAGALDLPTGYKLRRGAWARFTIPVDRRARLIGASLPHTVPLLAYDEKKGLWLEETRMTLTTVGGVPAYTARVKHFTTYNADTFFGAGAACVRVFSPSLPGQYDLEVMSPYPDGTPHYKKYPIDNATSTEHVIYNITPNANITLAPMTQGANPQLLGFYIVNSGGAQNPSTSPNPPPGPPYTSCQNFVVLKVGSAPDSPFGGEFLHGLGYIAAADLGFDDLTSAGPTGNALIDAIVTASRNYYGSIDPNNLRTTFAAFKSKNGFAADPNTPNPGEIIAQYANSGDLGFGRDMHCLKQASGDVACYVTNYGTGYSNIAPGGGTNDDDDANAAGQRSTVGQSAEVATVAMEYSAIENDPAGDRVVKFFVYKKGLTNYGRSISANLDGRGERPVPQLCMICHGGQIPSQVGGVPAFGTAAQVKLGSRFLPFDYRFYTFPTNPATLSKANQEASIKNLNEQIVNSAPPAPATDPINEVVSGMYNNGVSATQIHDFTVPGWLNGASANEPNQQTFYTGVVANVCRTCHTAQPYAQLQFNTSDKFVNVGGVLNKLMLGTAQLRVCGDYVMPHALRTHDIFWNVYWDVGEWGPPPTPFPTQFQTFGDGVGGATWQAGLCTSFISPLVSSPSQFYEHTIQAIWNGKCVLCHIAGGIAPFALTEGVSYNNLVPARVVPGNDNPNTPGNTLLLRLSYTDPRDPNFNASNFARMPQGCAVPPTPPGPGQLPCLTQGDIDVIRAWVRSGAN